MRLPDREWGRTVGGVIDWDSSEAIVMDGDESLHAWVASNDRFKNHVIFKTSGSSGVEKWIALSTAAIEWSARTVNEFLGIAEDDICGLALPIIHVGGFCLMARAHFSGAGLMVFDQKWSAEKFCEWCEVEKISVTSLVPTQVRDLVSAGLRAPECLRVTVVGGGSFDDDLREAACKLGWAVLPSYGMTETSSQIATGEGLPLLSGWEAKLVEGRLALRGRGLLTGVITRNESGFQFDDPKRDGWFLTNDLAEIDERELKILGRCDRKVKILGELVDLDELERSWRGRLSCEVVLIARPDERRGQRLWLFVEGRTEGIAEINKDEPGLTKLSAWKVLEELPRSPLGKLDRASLSEIDIE